MDIKRVTSALLGFPLVVIILTFGNKYVVDVFLAFVAMLGMQEYFNAISKEAKPVKWLGYLACFYCSSSYNSREFTRTTFEECISIIDSNYNVNIVFTCYSYKHENKF